MPSAFLSWCAFPTDSITDRIAASSFDIVALALDILLSPFPSGFRP
jgi:hypothetical protein